MKELSDCMVLIVDDVKTNINILVESLKGLYRLGFALDGESALKFARTRRPDLILLDVMMPGMDGYEVCRKIKSDPNTSGIPVLFVTAMDNARNKTAGFEAGAVDYITKPFDMAEVKARIKTHLELKLANEKLKRQRDRMQQSLDLAMEVQQNLLPRDNPRLPGLDISGCSIYCDETGGDYYDFLSIGPDDCSKIGIVVGDVSEHGIQSALLMASARAYLRQRSAMPGSLAEIATDVNRQFCRDVKESGRFMTMFLCEVDVRERGLRWVRAGHDPALLFDNGRNMFVNLPGGGLPLGVLADAAYTEERLLFGADSTLVIGTDGIWESRNEAGRAFGRERYKSLIRELASKPAGEISQAIIHEVQSFRGGMPQEDDVTLIVVRML